MKETELLKQITYYSRLIQQKESQPTNRQLYLKDSASKKWESNKFKISNNIYTYSDQMYNLPKHGSLTYSKLKVIQNSKEKKCSVNLGGSVQQNSMFSSGRSASNNNIKHISSTHANISQGTGKTATIPKVKSNSIYVNPARLMRITTGNEGTTPQSDKKLSRKIYINREVQGTMIADGLSVRAVSNVTGCNKNVDSSNHVIRTQVHVNRKFIADKSTKSTVQDISKDKSNERKENKNISLKDELVVSNTLKRKKSITQLEEKMKFQKTEANDVLHCMNRKSSPVSSKIDECRQILTSSKPSKMILLSKTKLVRQKGFPLCKKSKQNSSEKIGISKTKAKWIVTNKITNSQLQKGSTNLKSSTAMISKQNPYKFVNNQNTPETKTKILSSKFKYVRQKSPLKLPLKRSPSKLSVTATGIRGRPIVKKQIQKLDQNSLLVSISPMKMIRNSTGLKGTYSNRTVRRSSSKNVIKGKPDNVRTKFKVVHNRSQTQNKLSLSFRKARSIVSKYKLARPGSLNKFKIDRRTSTERKCYKKDLKYGNMFPQNMTRRRPIHAKKINCYGLPQFMRRKLLERKIHLDGVIRVGGERFHVSGNGRTLKRIGSGPTKMTRLNLGGVTFVRSSSGDTFQKTNTHVARNRAIQAKQKSITILTKKLRKNNQPCLIYNRFGQCSGKSRGVCNKVHDPKRIAICRKFLRGACENKNCLLSHDVGPEKMPTCRHYLAGVCVRDGCPYLHVKVNSTAPLCINFLQGYCHDADKCKKRHVPICPEFERSGNCSKEKCPYPHPKHTQKASPQKTSTAVKPKETVFTKLDEVSDQNNQLNPRYYSANNRTEGNDNDQKEVCENFKSEEEGDERVGCKWLSTRPKVGQLPGYIPLL